MKWMIENIPAVSEAVSEMNCAFGTVDSWLVYNLTGASKGGIFVTDVTNASRTQLMNVRTLKWDKTLCEAFGVPEHTLPEIKSNSEVYGHVVGTKAHGVAIASCMGDQQAATLGNGCTRYGQCKNTYGTGCFIFANTGTTPAPTTSLLTTVAYKLGPNAETIYALEGSISGAGATLDWLRKGLQIINKPSDVDELAGSVVDSDGVVVVPAFAGLLAPYWKPDARGAMFGMTYRTTRAHIVRGALDGIALSVGDVISQMTRDLGAEIVEMRADGGVSNSTVLMQIQTNVLGFPVLRGKIGEATAFGSAFSAGLAVGFWKSQDDLVRILEAHGGTVYTPQSTAEEREEKLARWLAAIPRSFALEQQ
eukprot:c20290_g1_i4.p1 GENE.c20290_g1_i4~~c20290_g1_i4.p1  ORF type:complete len:364 (+),score=90.85 c20290_g1_i4:584-1675(+)